MTIGAFSSTPAEPPVVPGLRVRTLLGRGGHGEVWSAEELVTGQRVAVKVGRQGGVGLPPSELALLSRIDHPHLVRLLRVVALPDGASAMVLDLAAGGSLAALVARRGPLSAGEVSTLLVPLAGALEQVHRRGLVHGDIAPGNVLFAADGRPLLGDLGTARVLGVRADPDGPQTWRTSGFDDPAGPAADPRAADVRGLAAVAWFALTGRPPGPTPQPADERTTLRAPALVRLLLECLSLDPGARPEPAELARRAWDAARPEPVRLAGEPGAPGRAATGFALPADGAGFTVDGGFPDDTAVAITRPPVRPPAQPRASPPSARGSSRPIGGRAGITSRVLGAVTHPLVLGGLALGGLAVTALATGFLAVPDRQDPVRAAGPAPVPSVSASASGPAAGPVPASGPAAVVPSSSAGLETELVVALNRIGAARATAFRTVSTRALSGIEEPGSPAATADRALVSRLHDAGRRLDGVGYTITGLRVRAKDGRRITVTVLAGTTAHRQIRVRDGAATPVPAQPARRLTITLVRSAGSPDEAGWMLRSIS